MEIIKKNLCIYDENIDNIKIVSIDNKYILFSYKLLIDSSVKYVEYIPENQYEIYIYTELFNNFPLWYIKYNIENKISFSVYMDLNLLHELIHTSIGINFVFYELYKKLNKPIKVDLKDKSYIVYDEPIIQPFDFKVKLYDYQLKSINKMLNIENNKIVNKISYQYPIKLDDTIIYYDPILKNKTIDELKLVISSSGGILSDDMGLGKTITTIGLITVNPYINNNKIKLSKNGIFNKLCIKATLIICPSHLIDQWKNEIERCNTKLKILIILTKTQHAKLYFSDFYNADIILTSLQFLMNFKYYPTLNYRNCVPSSIDFSDRNNLLNEILSKIINKSIDDIKKEKTPLFEYFIFNRLVLDESHEIFGELLNNSLNKYIAKWIRYIDANNYWYISGTPFINDIGLYNCSKFIQLELNDIDRNIKIDLNKLDRMDVLTKNIKEYMYKDYIWSNILNKICIRHRQIDVENQVKIPGFEETVIWIKLTDLEKKLYESKTRYSETYLQQLCCHPLILDSNKKILGNVEIDLSIMKDKLIDFHKNNLNKYISKLEKLDNTNQAFYMLKKSFESQISESKYMINILEKIENNELTNEDGCIICMDEIINPTLTTCGHLYCYECIKLCLTNKKICPLCKTNLVGKDLLLINNKTELDNNNPLIQKYGSKLGKLISMIRTLLSLEETRIIVFSQWDDMLTLIGKSLVENGIENTFIKGNVYCRNSAINKFKIGKDSKVIMLSLKNSASGTNLTEATHIFFVEPINSSKEECKVIEGQAIARACRIGQKNKISVIRILIENTIEEIIYKKNYL